MKAVVQIVFGYFECLPLQRWLNIVGAVLLAAGIVLAMGASNPRVSIDVTAFPGLVGAFLIVAVPFCFGGITMRYASSRTLMHLRPHGRVCMLLGATLVITLLALVVTLPILAEHHFLKTHGFRVPFAKPTAWFRASWMVIATIWLITFMSSSSRMIGFVGLLPLTMVIAKRAVGPDTLTPDVRIAFVAALSAWLIFAIWYWRTPKVSRLWRGGRSLVDFGSFKANILGRRPTSTRAESSSLAVRQYLLGSTSIIPSVFGSALAAVAMLAVTTMWPDKTMPGVDPVFLASAFAICPGGLSYLILRRARWLWLRAGVQRLELFRLVERIGLSAALQIFCTAAIILLAVSMHRRQEQLPVTLLYATILCVLAICVFYFGFSLTRGWNAMDSILGLGVLALIVGIFAAINPLRRPAIATVWITPGLLVPLTLLLRWHASRRWRALDWRIAQLPRLMRIQRM